MDISVAALKALIFKISRFVNGQADETVEIDGGRRIKTLAGIEQTVQERSYIQVVKDYPSFAQAELDALNGLILKEGDVVKVYNDPDLRLNKFFEVTSASNLRPMDGYELMHFFPDDVKIRRESTNIDHEMYQLTIDKPLVGQSVHGAFGFQAFLRTGLNTRSLLNGTVVYGIQEDGQPYTEIIKMSTNDSLDIRAVIEDRVEYFLISFIASPINVNSEFTIVTSVDIVYKPERY